jgi:ubiquinol-cytochrome c reductase iron-sulfur subunit
VSHDTQHTGGPGRRDDEDLSSRPSGGSGELQRRGEHADGLEQRFPDPGLPAHVHRRGDTDPRAARRAERQVAAWFLLSIVGTVIFIVGFFTVDVGSLESASVSTWVLGAGMGLALFAIGIGAVHWAKALMPDDEVVQKRKPLRSSEEDRAEAIASLREGVEDSGIARRKLILGSLVAAVAPLGAMALLPLRDLWVGRNPVEQLSRTAWAEGIRLVSDVSRNPIRAADMRIGEVVHVLPEGIDETDHPLDEVAKAAVLVIRLEPEELQRQPERAGWDYEGIVAFSKICTHVGCPVGLYEQTTHHLLCPCHQSTFDVTQYCEVVFGPAARPLPQLAISVDDEGYLVAQGDFTQPVGPSFWERG